MKAWSSHRLVAVTILAVLLLPAVAEAKPIGISMNDKAVYQGKVVETNLQGVTSVYTNEFSIQILETDNSSSFGRVAYNLTITMANGTLLDPPWTSINHTTIFDPFYNYSYIGSTFYPFVYTDLQNGTATKIPVTVPVNLPETKPLLVNSSVVRTSKFIYVGVSIPSGGNHSQPIRWAMQYNATTGVLANSSVFTNLFGLSRSFFYTLLSFHHSPPVPDNSGYIVLAVAIAPVVIIAVLTLFRRPSRSERGKARMKEKFRRKR